MSSLARAPAPSIFAHHVPAKPLSDCVGLIWYFRGGLAPTGSERVLPTGTVELVMTSLSLGHATAVLRLSAP